MDRKSFKLVDKRKYYRTAGRLFFTVVCLYMLVMVIVGSSIDTTTSAMRVLLLNSLLVTLACIFLPSVIFIRKAKGNEFFIKRASVSLCVLSVFIGLGLFFLASGVNGLSTMLFESTGSNTALLESSMPDLSNIVNFLIVTVVICLLPAVAEELFFRGVLLYSWKSMGKTKAVLLVALLFALMHGSLIVLPAIFIVGIALGSIAYDSKSLVPAIIVHFVYNFLGVVITALSDTIPDVAALESTTESVWMVAGVFIGASALILIPAILKFRRRCKKEGVFDSVEEICEPDAAKEKSDDGESAPLIVEINSKFATANVVCGAITLFLVCLLSTIATYIK